MKRVVDTTNNRQIKPRDDIYLIKDNKIPSTLIECGFLSNDKEAKLLKVATSDNVLDVPKEYRDKLRASILKNMLLNIE